MGLSVPNLQVYIALPEILCKWVKDICVFPLLHFGLISIKTAYPFSQKKIRERNPTEKGENAFQAPPSPTQNVFTPSTGCSLGTFC